MDEWRTEAELQQACQTLGVHHQPEWMDDLWLDEAGGAGLAQLLVVVDPHACQSAAQDLGAELRKRVGTLMALELLTLERRHDNIFVDVQGVRAAFSLMQERRFTQAALVQFFRDAYKGPAQQFVDLYFHYPFLARDDSSAVAVLFSFA